MLVYEPGSTVAHRLDPRTKLGVQLGFAVAAVAHTTALGLVLLTLLTAGILAVARLSPIETLYEFRFVFPFLLAAPLLEGLVLGAPWFMLAEAQGPALASYRVVLILLVSAAYVRTTPARDSQAAIRRLVPGRVGVVLGVGTGLVFRFLPVLRDDLGRIREAIAARLGSERSLVERIQIVATAGFARSFDRADRLGVALRARCFAWNPTLPALAFSRTDLPGLGLAVALLLWAIV